MEAAGGAKGSVCVTGGAGFLASWIIKRLLQHGYSVHTTIRSHPKFKEDISHLKSLPEAPHKLKIFEAELEKPKSFADAIDGCTGVFHVAHHMEHFMGELPQEAAIETSVDAALGILMACVHSKTVKKVVYTSSASAAGSLSNAKDIMEINENTWCSEVEDFRTVQAPGISYAVVKTLTEQAAIKFAEEHGLDLVTVLPSLIVGPFIGPNIPLCIQMALSIVFGNEVFCKLMKSMSVVHVDDVALAQIFLFECPNAKGRHICSAADITIHDLAKFLGIKHPELQLRSDLLKEIEEVRPVHHSSEKLRNLGFKFKYGFEEMYDQAISCCKEKGFL